MRKTLTIDNYFIELDTSFDLAVGKFYKTRYTGTFCKSGGIVIFSNNIYDDNCFSKIKAAINNLQVLSNYKSSVQIFFPDLLCTAQRVLNNNKIIKKNDLYAIFSEDLTRFKKKTKYVPNAFEFIKKIADAIISLHNCGIAHRNIRLENILIDKEDIILTHPFFPVKSEITKINLFPFNSPISFRKDRKDLAVLINNILQPNNELKFEKLGIDKISAEIIEKAQSDILLHEYSVIDFIKDLLNNTPEKLVKKRGFFGYK
jgi:serine/threonine protein kinase